MTYQIGIGPNLRKSAYFDATVRDGVKSFSVYNHMLIPGHFGDPDAEYDRLLNGVVMWDVAAQRQVQLQGPDAARLAQYLTPRHLGNTKVGQGRYVPLCDHDGWVINDPVLLKLSEDCFWLSVADSDVHLWAAAIARERGWDVLVSEPDVSPLAIQGPLAVNVVATLFGEWVHELRYFGFVETDLDGIPLVLARSGWSKQGGFELYLRDSSRGDALWEMVKEAGAAFDIGPGAPNDTERLESGLISYGADMRWQTYRTNPFEIGLGALVDLDAGNDFVGRSALEKMRAAGLTRTRVGLLIEGRPTPPGHPVPLSLHGKEVGYVSEFAFSRRIGATIGVAVIGVPASSTANELSVIVDQHQYAARLAEIPFV